MDAKICLAKPCELFFFFKLGDNSVIWYGDVSLKRIASKISMCMAKHIFGSKSEHLTLPLMQKDNNKSLLVAGVIEISNELGQLSTNSLLCYCCILQGSCGLWKFLPGNGIFVPLPQCKLQKPLN